MCSLPISSLYQARLFVEVYIKGIDKMLVFAAPLTGTPVLNRMLLGLNTLNNWNYEVKRTENVIIFSESSSLPIGANSKNKYVNYFDKNGNYVLLDE